MNKVAVKKGTEENFAPQAASGPIEVTRPCLPPLKDFLPFLEDIWNRKWLTNNAPYHQELERRLAEYLKVEYLSLLTNGTLPLEFALRALGVAGEVITTPYSFIATAHVLWWSGLKPVFVDVDEATCNLDPDKIEAAITPKTSAVMPVHVYGQPCDTEKIGAIAGRHGLKVIYDAAHAFAVEKDGRSLLEAGDMATLSFHATKIYNTAEGGALICRDAETKRRIDYLRNFGIAGETEVLMPGLNGKMDEMRAAFGLLNLRHIGEAIEKRRAIVQRYRAALDGTPGLRYLEERPGIRQNYGYFPIFIEAGAYGRTRDELYAKLKENRIFARRYFYPLITAFPPYSGLASAARENLPAANRLADSVICLPLHQDLSEGETRKIIDLVAAS